MTFFLRGTLLMERTLLGCLFCVATVLPLVGSTVHAVPLELLLRQQTLISPDSVSYHRLETKETWLPAETAVILCDAWDQHHCKNAVDRLTEFAPRLSAFVDAMRKMGVTIIHSPSDCMPAYAHHPARVRTLAVPSTTNPPESAQHWCSMIDSEAGAIYPIDQSLGGEDDLPQEHAIWSKQLLSLGRNPQMPWKMQSSKILIDDSQDFISDRGDEVWRVLESKQIKNVVLVGVHLNMCVLGRPFGLRRMVMQGRRVVLVRDLTDTMYDPKQWPWINHFTGTDRMIDYVEQYVCPTISSNQILGDSPFRFANDTRPTLAIVIAEEEYGSHRTLPAMANRHLGNDFRIVVIHADSKDPNTIPGLEAINDADLLLVSARRRGLPKHQMDLLRTFVAAGKPVVGIRTASHAWEPKTVLVDRESWPEFDRDVFGIKYSNHFENNLHASVTIAKSTHPILNSIGEFSFMQTGSLYKIAPVSNNTTVLITGSIPNEPAQPVATTFLRPDGGRSFYTAIGHEKDLALPQVTSLVVNAIYWAAGLAPPASLDTRDPSDPTLRWVSIRRIRDAQLSLNASHTERTDPLWCRAVLVPGAISAAEGIRLRLSSTAETPAAKDLDAWLDGKAVPLQTSTDGQSLEFFSGPETLEIGRPCLVVIALKSVSAKNAWLSGTVQATRSHKASVDSATELNRWQIYAGNNPGSNSMPLPAQFGGSADAVTVLE